MTAMIVCRSHDHNRIWTCPAARDGVVPVEPELLAEVKFFGRPYGPAKPI
jgi:hypothetical protein